MAKTFIGPKLRRLRRDQKQTQAEMAQRLGVSPAYINLLENNQRSLSVQMLMAISDTYGVDWKDLTKNDADRLIADLRNALDDPSFLGDRLELQELRAAVDHAPRLVEQFLRLHQTHRTTIQRFARFQRGAEADGLLRSSPEAVIHDFFRNHSNHFPDLERAAESSRAALPVSPETLFVDLREGLKERHGVEVVVRPVDEMGETMRIFDDQTRAVSLSQALNSENRAFQLAHVLGMVQHGDLLDALVESSGLESRPARTRLQIELANYFAAAFMLPYADVLTAATETAYDLDRIAANFGASFEQVCQRVTTLQADGARGVPFFFLRVDRAGNVTKRFNSTSFNLAEYGGACAVWNIHSAFYTPGVILPQFVEMPDGERFFTLSRTVHRPVFSKETQDRRLTLALGCPVEHASRIRYSTSFNMEDPDLYAPIGTNCHMCPRKACSQRAHQPVFVDLPMSANRRGTTRYES